jgi:hypothetical protein
MSIGELRKGMRAGDQHPAWDAPNLVSAAILRLSRAPFEEVARFRPPTPRNGPDDEICHRRWQWPPVRVPLNCRSHRGSRRTHALAVYPSPDVGRACGRELAAMDTERASNGARCATPSFRHRPEVGRPAPIRGHGPHRYLFQLVVLARPVAPPARGTALDSAEPRGVLTAATAPPWPCWRTLGAAPRDASPSAGMMVGHLHRGVR